MHKQLARIFSAGLVLILGWTILDCLIRWQSNGVILLGVSAALGAAAFLVARFVLPWLDHVSCRGFRLGMGGILLACGIGLARWELGAEGAAFWLTAVLVCVLVRRILRHNSAVALAFLFCAGVFPFALGPFGSDHQIWALPLGLLALLLWSYYRAEKRRLVRVVLLAGMSAAVFAGCVLNNSMIVLLAALLVQLVLEIKPARAFAGMFVLMLVFGGLGVGYQTWMKAGSPGIVLEQQADSSPRVQGAGSGQEREEEAFADGRSGAVFAPCYGQGCQLLILVLALAGAVGAVRRLRPGTLTLARVSVLGGMSLRLMPGEGADFPSGPFLLLLAVAALWRLARRRRIAPKKQRS